MTNAQVINNAPLIEASGGEVFTPISLRNEMLKMTNAQVFNNAPLIEASGGEVFTPISLRNEMLKLITEDDE
jgi:phosphoribosyl-dephospho-CoA transferase